MMDTQLRVWFEAQRTIEREANPALRDSTIAGNDGAIDAIPCDGVYGLMDACDAIFISNAATVMRPMLDALETVGNLHRPVETKERGTVCGACDEPPPCATMFAVAKVWG